jgi:rieske iron-sulfur protein
MTGSLITNMITRRKLFRTAAIALTAAPALANAASAKKPDRLPPQVGDVLAYPSWENDGKVIVASEIKAGQRPITAYPRDPLAEITRERYRLNQLLVVRLFDQGGNDSVDDLDIERVAGHDLVDEVLTGRQDEQDLDPHAGEVFVYSGVCTHTGCAVSEWNDSDQHFICPCHSSEFDPLRRAKVINGPARRALPSLSIQVKNDQLVVTGGFSGKVGAKKKKSL